MGEHAAEAPVTDDAVVASEAPPDSVEAAAPADGPAAVEEPSAPPVPAAAYEQAIALLTAAGDNPDAQRAALKHAAGLAVAAGIAVTLPVELLTEDTASPDAAEVEAAAEPAGDSGGGV